MAKKSQKATLTSRLNQEKKKQEELLKKIAKANEIKGLKSKLEQEKKKTENLRKKK